MKGEDRIRKAHRVAKAYEDAGFLFHLDGKARLKQMAAWAGITETEAKRFSQMVEYVFAEPEPIPMALSGDDDDNAPWVMSVDIEQMNKDYEEFVSMDMTSTCAACDKGDYNDK